MENQLSNPVALLDHEYVSAVVNESYANLSTVVRVDKAGHNVNAATRGNA